MQKIQQKNQNHRFIGLVLVLMLFIGILPMNTAQVKASGSSVNTVSTPNQLKKAVKNGAEEVIFQTNKSGTIKIPQSASGNSTALIIDAPNAKISNSASFESVTIKNCKFFTEKASENDIVIAAKKTKLVFMHGVMSTVTLKKAKSKITIVANEQAYVNVSVDKKAKLTISGDTTAAVKVITKVKGVNVASSVPVSITPKKTATITFKKGSEGSIINLENKDIQLNITNESNREPIIRNVGGITTYPTPTVTPEPTQITYVPEYTDNSITNTATINNSEQGGYTIPSENNGNNGNSVNTSPTPEPITDNTSDITVKYTNFDEDYINALSSLIKGDSFNSVSKASNSTYHTNRVIVKGEPIWDDFTPDQIIKTPYGEYIVQFSDTASAYSFIEAQNNNPSVEYAEEDKYLSVDPSTKSYATTSNTLGSWGTEYIEADILTDWISTNLNPSEVLVAVVDTGICYNHPFLQGHISSNGYDIIDGDSDPTDNYDGHGTHVSGTIVDCTNGLPIKILPVRVLDYDGYGTDLSVATGIRYSTSKGAKVINLSLGGGHSCIIDSAINEAVNSGVVVCVAAGNEGSNTAYTCPAHLQNCIVVSALEPDESIAYFSNYGSSVDIAAPGVSILSCVPLDSYEYWDGTSMATPHVSAASAMVLMIHPDYSPSEIEDFLKSCAKDLGSIGKDDFYGYGSLKLSLATPNIYKVSMTIKQLPKKTDYYIGETLDSTGLILDVLYSDGSHESVTSGYTCSPTTMSTAGTQQITVTYDDMSAIFSVNVKENKANSVVINTLPNRLEYYDGEALDLSGLTLKKNYDSGESEIISSGFEYSPTVVYLSDVMQAKDYSEKRTITVSLEDFSDTFEVTVKTIAVSDIYFYQKPSKVSYYKGSKPDTSDMILGIKYNNGSESYINSGYTVSPSTFSSTGKQNVSISYAGKTISYEVTVTENQLSHIKVETLPNKTEYTLSETFDPAGLTISLNYEDGTKEVISSGFTYVTPEWTPGETKVTVLYDSLATVFTITIKNERQLSDWVPIESVPAGAEIAEKKWAYDLTENTESTSDTLDGWNLTGSDWRVTDSGVVSYTTFPSTFDTTHDVYNIRSKEPLQAYENTNSKRTVTNTFGGWVYWHWMYNVAFANNTARMISDRKGTFDQYGNSGKGFWFGYFSAFISSIDAPYLSNLYCCSRNQAGYNCIDIMPDKSSLGTGTPRYFRFEFYNSEYTDYSKVYLFSKITHLESTTEIEAGNGISNVQCLVKYYK